MPGTLRRCASLLLLALLAASGEAQAQKLDPPLPVVSTGGVKQYRLSPDGGTLAYSVEIGSTLTIDELYTVPVAGGPAWKLAANSTWASIGFRISPDSQRIAYLVGGLPDRLFVSDLDGTSSFEVASSAFLSLEGFTPDGRLVLYRMPQLGVRRIFHASALVPGASTEVLLADPFVQDLLLHPNSTHVAVRSAPSTAFGDPVSVFVAPLSGASVGVRLNASGTSVGSHVEFSPDGTRLLFREENAIGVASVVSAALDGSERFAYPLPAGSDPTHFALDPNDRDLHVVDHDRILRMPLDGGGPVVALTTGLRGVFARIDSLLAGDGHLAFSFVESFNTWRAVRGLRSTASDGSGFADLRDGSFSFFELDGPGIHALFRSVDGLGSVRLDGRSAARALDPTYFGSWELSPAGDELLWFSDDGSGELRVAPSSGLGPTRVVGQVFPPGAQGARSLSWTSDGQRAFFLGDARFADDVQVFSAATGAPSVPVQHTTAGAITAVGGLGRSWMSADGARVAFTQKGPGPGSGVTLYTAPTDGSALATPLAGPLVGLTFADATPAGGFTPDGARFVYGEVESGAMDRLVSVPADGSSPPVVLVGGLVLVSDLSLAFTPDSARVVLQTEGLFGLLGEVLSVPVDGSSPTSSVSDGPGAEARLSPDGARVVFRVAGGAYRVAPSDGASAPVPLGGTKVVPAQSVGLFTPDSSRFVFTAGSAVSATELCSAPLAGGAPLVLATLAAGESFPGGDARYGFTPDGARVVFPVDLGTGASDVRSVPVDGGGPPVVLVDGGSLPVRSGPVFASDGSRFALGTAPPGASGEVWIASTEASFATFRVPLAADLDDVAFSPDGTRFVFAAGGKLFSAPAGRRGRPVPVMPTSDPDEEVREFALDGTSRRILYVADQGEDGVFRLFASPLAGTNDGVPLAGSVGPLGDVSRLLVTPDGARVVFAHDVTFEGSRELFVAEVRPSLQSVTPASGRADAEVVVTLVGRNFVPGATVTFGGVRALVQEVMDSTRLRVRVPPLSSPLPAGAVAVPVVVSDGVLSSTEPVVFTYVVPSTPAPAEAVPVNSR